MDRELVSPNLFIVGAAKSGTTSIHNYLNQHPEIHMCTPKEPHFLINKEIGVNRIPSGVINSEEYYDLFYKGKSLNYRGESSVMYLMYPEIVIPKIKYHFGDDVKIIIALRTVPTPGFCFNGIHKKSTNKLIRNVVKPRPSLETLARP